MNVYVVMDSFASQDSYVSGMAFVFWAMGSSFWGMDSACEARGCSAYA